MGTSQETAPRRDHFAATGYVGPVRILASSDCQKLLRRLDAAGEPHTWPMGKAASSRAFFEASTHPAIVSVLADILGEDVMLWGASLVRREPDERHAWHADAEAHLAEGRVVNVWLGLENTDPESSLELIPGSHHYGHPVQKHAALGPSTAGEDNGRARPTAAVLNWARSHDPDAEATRPAVSDGEALFFDGALWHGSHNRSRVPRTALLLKYAAPTTSIYIPSRYEWPLERLESPRPPCVMVRGAPAPEKNSFVAVPEPTDHASEWTSPWWTHGVPVPTPGPAEETWRSHSIFSGPTPGAAMFSSHSSTLEPDHTPHPPHRHLEEEILIVLDGQAALTVGGDETRRTIDASRGTVAYYPASHPHTLTATGDGPVTYLMFKWWSGDASHDGDPLQPTVVDTAAVNREHLASGDGSDFATHRILDGPTDYLWKLHSHVSRLAPGAGYAPHVDPYDVVLVVLGGAVEEGGETVGPDGVLFFSAGHPHGLHNPGDTPARYLVFEFHPAFHERPRASLLRRLGRRWLPTRVKTVLKRILPIPHFPG